jgi:uncharacterized protein (TIGR02246 family)
MITRPEDAHRIYVDAFNSGNVEAVLRLYDLDATFVPEPGRVLEGLKAIGEALQQFQSVGKMSAKTRYCINSDGVALASASWQIKGTGPDGKSIEVEGTSAEVLRRQNEGHWLFAIDHPFGAS